MSFAPIVDTWLELASVTSRRDLEADASIDPDWRPSLAGGAAGIAHVIGTIASDRDDASLRDESRRWFQIAKRMPSSNRSDRHSIAFGVSGIVAGQAAAFPSKRTITSLVDTLNEARARAPAEYMLGLAGQACAALAAKTDDESLRETIRELARRLERRALPTEIGFAHGALGVVVARLALVRASNAAVDPALVAWLRDYDPQRVLVEVPRWRRSWCNGLAGFVFGWVLAAELANDERCREHAIAAAPLLLDELDDSGGSVCCGLGGRAYALLAIARLDGRDEWIEHAIRLTRLALGMPQPSAGLWKGIPGLVALAHQLERPARARFPFVEVG